MIDPIGEYYAFDEEVLDRATVGIIQAIVAF